MKYAIIKCVNGNFSVHAEGITDIPAAKVSYHNLCAALWNEQTVESASVKIVDEEQNCVEGCWESVSHKSE